MKCHIHQCVCPGFIPEPVLRWRVPPVPPGCILPAEPSASVARIPPCSVAHGMYHMSQLENSCLCCKSVRPCFSPLLPVPVS